jgi:signal transduction histidine kinase
VLGHSTTIADFSRDFKPSHTSEDKIDPDGDQASFGKIEIHGRDYRVIRVLGIRNIDPGDKQGGVRKMVTVYYGSPVRRVWRAIYKAVNFYAISSLVVLAVTGILMSWLLNRGLAPLHELASSAASVSVTSWTFAPPEDARRTRELAPLVTALESVLLGLQQSFEQQKRFVGDAAHELKTNVAVVKSSLQLLRMKPRSSAEYQTGLERCLADCERMEATVAQMLTLARLEETSHQASGESSTHLFVVLRDVTLALDTTSQTHDVPILISGEKSLVAVIEPEQFRLLCTNLLMNALQHSPKDSVVTIDIEHHENSAEVRFCDDGEGIDPADLPRIFERFSRSDPSRSRKTGGTGLGLAICKAITDKCDGSIQIESELGKGTKVIVRLPLTRLPQLAQIEH